MIDGVSPRDDPTRQAIRGSLDETLFVEAGAGTGKTSELVRRVLALVESERTPITSVAAITFTEAAAADLRSRLHERLVDLAPSKEWARTALGGLDEASVTTIHGFAERILGEHPLAAGLPLRFRVTDEIEAELEFERRFSAFLESLSSAGDVGELVAASMAVGLALPALKDLAREVDEAWDRHRAEARRRMSIYEIRSESDAVFTELTAAMGGLSSLSACCGDPDDKLISVLDGIEAELEAVGELEDWIDRLEWCCSLLPLRSSVGSKAAWRGMDVRSARHAVAQVEAMRKRASRAFAVTCSGHSSPTSPAPLSRQPSNGAARERSASTICSSSLTSSSKAKTTCGAS